MSERKKPGWGDHAEAMRRKVAFDNVVERVTSMSPSRLLARVGEAYLLLRHGAASPLHLRNVPKGRVAKLTLEDEDGTMLELDVTLNDPREHAGSGAAHEATNLLNGANRVILADLLSQRLQERWTT